ncbi:enoyl-CoA hydratase/isomerase family protein [Virgibacillus sp. NKC19-3]|uniref:enoyl-CoA hydratase-related protein n=1 Tax=Virgibacillus saliphilus TaxID=2831674 RepID=UPI001C9B499A|nr:enoyl-CoA hydratase-related protein [Virgibacillus sp. NKC19-3]MBY7144279.1 enoyl-CoA hydratase/isomerase family protein [Virgibacillus sp. NKC19-3]
MEYQFLNLTYESNIAIVEINAPPANTLSTKCISELRATIQDVATREDIHGLIITGGGRFFSAGADIKEFVPALGDTQKGLELSKAGQSLCNEIEGLQKPVIAAINGPALGGGMELAMACHYRIASEGAVFGLPELKLGLLPSFGGTQRLSRITNTATALDIILTGKQLTSKEAQDLDIVQVTVPEEDLISTTVTVATSFVDGKSMTGVKRVIECVVKGSKEPLEDGLERERNQFADLFLTTDAKEGVQAFVEKRKPQFNHS